MFDVEAFSSDFANLVEAVDRSLIYKRGGSEIIYHYTTAAGLLGIIDSGSFRATHIRYLNDSKEYEYAREQISKQLARGIKNIAGMSQNQNVLRLLANAMEIVARKLALHQDELALFVVCFCVEGDRVDQWKSYGNNGFGYAIGFDIGALNAISVLDSNLVTVRYGTREIERFMQESIAYCAKVVERHYELDSESTIQDELISNLQNMITRISACFKHEGFAHEQEVRVIAAGDGTADNLSFVLKGSIPAPALTVPQISGGLRKIVVGPSSYRTIAEASVRTYLAARSLDRQVEVTVSDQPYRTFR